MATSNGTPQSGHTHEKFGERMDHINEQAQQLMDDARGAVQDIGARIDLQGRVQRNPYGMVLAAVGVGYVLGGGLFTPMTARLVRLGVRLAALPFVKDELFNMAEAAISGMGSQGRGGQGPTNA